MTANAVTKTRVFDPKSSWFVQSLINVFLTVFAAAGVMFAKTPAVLSGEIVTTLSTGGVYAIIGVVISAVIFPIYNAWRQGLTWSGVLSSVSVWVSVGTALFALLALTGIAVPEGTVQEIIAAARAKDWMGLLSVIALNIGNPLIRWLKERFKTKPLTTGNSPG